MSSSTRLRRTQAHLDATPAASSVTLGNAQVNLATDLDSRRIPIGYLARNQSQKDLEILQWMMKKDAMGQDAFLLGPPGAKRRRLAMAYAELAKREVEFLSISQDTTVADIKQRREIEGKTARFEDSPAVRAAIHGRILILEGVEKAERNVLSTLNNLLENREMALEDGRFLTNPKRFDEITKQHGLESIKKRWDHDDGVRLVRVSDAFRVIVLGVPVPEYEGNPLDPPFRSRFQSRDVEADDVSAEEIMQDLGRTTTSRIRQAKKALDVAALITMEGVSGRVLKRSSINGEFSRVVDTITSKFPSCLDRFIIACIFPIPMLGSTEATHRHLIMEVFDRFALLDDPMDGKIPTPEEEKPHKYRTQPRDDAVAVSELHASTPQSEFRDRVLGPRFTSRSGYVLQRVVPVADTIFFSAEFALQSQPSLAVAKHQVRGGTFKIESASTLLSANEYVAGVEYHDQLVTQMMMFHACDLDFSLIGPRGSGKTCLVKRFASMIDMNVTYFPLHRDMTSQDLFMRRGTLANGDTVWHPSPLLLALKRGDLLVLDAVEQVAAGTLATLSSLLHDREGSLPDGNRVIKSTTPFDLQLPGDWVCHANFRIVAVGRPSSADASGKARSSWLTSEVVACFMPFLWIRPLSEREETVVINRLVDNAQGNNRVQCALKLAHHLREKEDDDSKMLSLNLSTRQLLRLAQRFCAQPPEMDVRVSLQNACLGRFLPSLARDALESAMTACEVPPVCVERAEDAPQVVRDMFKTPIVDPQNPSRQIMGRLIIGQVSAPIYVPKNAQEASLVPDTFFIENPRQSRLLGNMLRDYMLGSHLLLMGNQGTGKNKLCDRLLHLLHLPRAYVQLDRDTTVNALTSQPVVENGVVRYEDSPLVQAARYGRILMIDEADKAPTHVTAILKSLLTDGEMLLSDGRRLVSHIDSKSAKDENVILVHPEFRCFVLANRPGYPFLGNDLFRETGDIFASHVVDNPDEDSEILLLKSWAPNVPEETLRKLTAAFQDLRGLVDQGKLQYPYSTRELVNAVKHMEKYPRDGLAVTLQNVFDFDRYAAEDRKTISVLFERHGIPVSLNSKYTVQMGDVTPLPEPVLSETWRPRKPGFSATNQTANPGSANNEIKLDYVIHTLPWKSSRISPDVGGGKGNDSKIDFPFVVSAVKVPLVRHEGRAKTFEEQVFSFSLPCSEFTGLGVGVIGACMLGESKHVMVATNDAYSALRFYRVNSPAYRDFDAFDASIPHFNFRDEYIPQVRRPAPSRCTMFGLPSSTPGTRFGFFSHDEQTVLVFDLESKSFRMAGIDPQIFRSFQEKGITNNVGLYAERSRTMVVTDLCESYGILIVYQQFTRVVLIFDLLSASRTTVTLPFGVDVVDCMTPYSFLIRSISANGEAFVLKAGAAGGRPPVGGTLPVPYFSITTSTEIVVAGGRNRTMVSGIVYTSFYITKVEQMTVDVGPASLGSRLHGAYSYVAPQSLPPLSANIKLSSNSSERRFVRAPGTLAQILEGFPVFIDPMQAQARGVDECLLKSFLRTSLTKSNAEDLVACMPLHLQGTHLMASLSVRRKSVKISGPSYNGGGYLGFELNAWMEVVDLERNVLRVIKVPLPETNRRRGSASLHEKFDSDGVEDADDAAVEEADDFDGLNEKHAIENSDESNSLFRQRAPYVYLFQTSSGDVLTLDRTGVGRIYQVDEDKLDKALESWRSMVGQDANEEDDLDFDKGGSSEDDDAETGSEEEEEDGEDDDQEEEDGDDDAQDEQGEEKDGDGKPGKGKRGAGKGKKGGKKSKRGGNASSGGRSGKTGKSGGKPRGGGGSSSSRRKGGNRQNSNRKGNGSGEGQGSGGSGGSGEGGSGGSGDAMSLPEPGQFRGSRALSPRDRVTAQARLDELRRLTRYFPNDEGIRKEMENLEERLEEADEAERKSGGADEADNALRARIERLKARLQRVQAQLSGNNGAASKVGDENKSAAVGVNGDNGANSGTGSANPRLRAEAQQLRDLIKRLEQQLRDGTGSGRGKGGFGDGEGEDGEDGEGGTNEGQVGGGGRGRIGKKKPGEAALDEQSRKQAKKMEKEAWNEVTNDLEQNPQEVALYARYKDSVASEIRELRATLDQMQAKKNERVWLRNKDVGDLDDRRLVDGLTGERNIYKRRGERPPDPFAFQDNPKRLTFLFDTSSSMSRYSMDGRLERSLEAATMAMEAFKGYEHKFAWKFRGHSGSTDDVTFVEAGKYPKDDAARLNVLRKMNAHAETCGSGDNTLEATRLAVREITKDEGDEYFCILFSDANIEQYNISPNDLKELLNLDERVNVFIVFIGSMGAQAQRLRAELPADRVFVTLSTSQIPQVLKRIFLSSVLKE